MADEPNPAAAAAAGAGGAAEAPKKSALVQIVLILNAVLMAAIAFMQYKKHKDEMSQPSIHDVVKAEMQVLNEEKEKGLVEEKIAEGPMLPLESFVVNLAQGDGPRRYLSMSPVLKFNKATKEEELNSRKPQIRDAIIGILNSKRPEDLLKLEGKTYLKEEIKAAINSFLTDGAAIDVYYVSFQIK